MAAYSFLQDSIQVGTQISASSTPTESYRLVQNPAILPSVFCLAIDLIFFPKTAMYFIYDSLTVPCDTAFGYLSYPFYVTCKAPTA